MSNLRGAVAQAIWLHRCQTEFGDPIDGTTVHDIHPNHQWMETADKAIEAMFDWLIAEDERWANSWPNSLSRDFAGNPFTMHATWLREKKAEALDGED